MLGALLVAIIVPLLIPFTQPRNGRPLCGLPLAGGGDSRVPGCDLEGDPGMRRLSAQSVVLVIALAVAESNWGVPASYGQKPRPTSASALPADYSCLRVPQERRGHVGGRDAARRRTHPGQTISTGRRDCAATTATAAARPSTISRIIATIRRFAAFALAN